MQKLKTSLLVPGLVLLSAQAVFAQLNGGKAINPPNAGHLYESRMRQQHAADRAQMLYYYSQLPETPTARVKENAAGLKHNTEAARDALAKFKAVEPANVELQKRLSAIEALLTKCDSECEMITKEADGEKGDMAKVAACCVDAHGYMEEARIKTEALIKDLGMKKIDIPKSGAAAKAKAPPQ